MIFIFNFRFLVAMALPLFIYFTDQSDLLVFSLIILYPAVDFTVFYSAIGSGIIIYIGLRYSIKRFINLLVNGFFCTFICFYSFLVLFISGYLMTIFNLYYLVNFIINPGNYLGSDVFHFVTHDLDNLYCAFLLIHVKPRLIINDVYNFNIKLISSYSNPSHFNSINETSNPILNKDLSKIIGGGYLSYKNIDSIGFINDLLENKKLLIKKISNYLATLEIDKTYTILPVIRWINDDTGLSNSITVSESLKINKLVDKELLANIFYKDMLKSAYKYNVINNNSEFMLMNRV